MKILVGDILQSKAQTLVNTVNCVGIMGKGIALEFKNRFPEMFRDYVQRCDRGDVKPGVPYVFKTLFPPQVINFPTKDHWKSVSKLSDIEQGLGILVAKCREWGVTSLAVPPLGCGNGQLEWKAVGPLIYRYLAPLEIPVDLYAPYGTNPKELSPEFLRQQSVAVHQRSSRSRASALNPAWVALVEIVKRIDEQPYHQPIGRTIFQKIAYVATDEGLPTGLLYRQASFGPFSKELKGVETKLINSSLLQEERLGSMFQVKVGPNYERVRSTFESSLMRWQGILDKTVDLFMRVRDTNQAELAATVLFAARTLKQSRRGPPAESDVLEFVMQWKQKRRPPLDRKVVAMTIRNLGMLNWLDAQPSPDLPLAEDEAISA